MGEGRNFINLALGAGVLGSSASFASAPSTPIGKLPPRGQKRGGNYFPNVVVYDHHGNKFRLYEDLIKDRVVMINFMTVMSHGIYPVSKYMAGIATAFAGQLDRDVFMYSITTDPKNDTVARLKALADEYRVRPGWRLLTSNSAADANAVSRRLYRNQGSHGYGAGHPIRMVHYGNDAVGVWGAFGADCNPALAVERLSRIKTRPASVGQQRRGPSRLGENIDQSHNRIS